MHFTQCIKKTTNIIHKIMKALKRKFKKNNHGIKPL